jgi:segregation and condensation protein B
MTFKDVQKLTGWGDGETHEAIMELRQSLLGRGIILLEQGGGISLGTHPEASKFLESLRQEELSGPLSKAAFETLAIIAYKGQSTKKEIDHIRGVNGYISIRNLLERGLIEKVPGTGDRFPSYQLTHETFRSLGISSKEELPGFGETQAKLSENQESGLEGLTV